MPMAAYTRVDFGSRIVALRAVGTALSMTNPNMPAQNASNSNRTCLKYINLMRVAKALQPLPSLDYTAFVPAVNVLAALVP